MHPNQRYAHQGMQQPMPPQHQMHGPPQQSAHKLMHHNFLAEFIENCGIVKSGRVEELAGKKLGVDGNKIIDAVNTVMREKEGLATLTQCVPITAYSEIGRLVDVLAKARVTPEYVFSGMSMVFQSKEKDALNSKSRDHNVNLLQLVGLYPSRVGPTYGAICAKAAEELQATMDEDGENYLFLYMKLYPDAKVSRAPYWSWAQLASYLPSRYIDDVYGCYEMLAFRGVDRVITKIDEQAYYYVTKADLTQAISQYAAQCGGISSEELPLVVAATSSHKFLNDPFVLLSPSVAETLARLVRDRSGALQIGGVQGLSLSRLARAVFGIEHCPVLLPTGECQPLSLLFDRKPLKKLMKLHFGSPLPPLFYFLQMAGLLSPGVLSTVATKQIVDMPTVVDSAEFRSVAEYIIPLRTQIVYQLVQSIQNQNQQMEITWVRRYNPITGSGREMPILQPPQIKLDEWDTRNFSAPSGTPFFTDVLALSQLAVPAAVYSNTDQACAAVLLKALDLLGYFTHATQTNSSEVSGPSVYSNALERCLTGSLSEYAVLLIEMLRTKTLHDKPLTVQAPPRSVAALHNPSIFAARLLSIVPIRLHSPWTGPMSAELCGFNGMARSLQRTLRSLTEVIATITLIESHGNPRSFNVDQFQREVQPKLPFSAPLMCTAGLIVQWLMENPTPQITLDYLNKIFPECIDLAADLGSLFYFWYYAGQIITVLFDDDQEAMQTAYTNYCTANLILSKMAVQLLGPHYAFLEVR